MKAQVTAGAPALAVFFSPEMATPSGSYSPSAAKPAQVVHELQARALRVEVSPVRPVTASELCLAHAPGYVNEVLAGRRPNGFGNTLGSVARSLPYTTGSMLTAARHALAHRVACAPCSGFHHAGWAEGHGFCTFNGLMVTAMVLLGERAVGRVGILDCDMHYGDGTDDILRSLGSPPIHHATAGALFHEPQQAVEFFRWLDEQLEVVSGCDLVLYQAGADPHVDDPLGGFLTTAQLRERDARVFDALLGRVPVAWNLAGGYQREPDGTIPKVLEIHANTAIECLRAMTRP